ncbi:hypothetical protein GN956_G8767 [Arapaima gigas]
MPPALVSIARAVAGFRAPQGNNQRSAHRNNKLGQPITEDYASFHVIVVKMNTRLQSTVVPAPPFFGTLSDGEHHRRKGDQIGGHCANVSKDL